MAYQEMAATQIKASESNTSATGNPTPAVELTAEQQSLLSTMKELDKEGLTNMINSSHDFRLGQIDGKEDWLTKHEQKSVEEIIERVKTYANTRNTNRVAEIYSFHALQNKVINTMDLSTGSSVSETM
jgi:hypothetical protein